MSRWTPGTSMRRGRGVAGAPPARRARPPAAAAASARIAFAATYLREGERRHHLRKSVMSSRRRRGSPAHRTDLDARRAEGIHKHRRYTYFVIAPRGGEVRHQYNSCARDAGHVQERALTPLCADTE